MSIYDREYMKKDYKVKKTLNNKQTSMFLKIKFNLWCLFHKIFKK